MTTFGQGAIIGDGIGAGEYWRFHPAVDVVVAVPDVLGGDRGGPVVVDNVADAAEATELEEAAELS